MSVRTPQWRMADRVLNGTLADRLAELYGESRSWEEVARRLYSDHGITVSGQTLRRWARELPESEPEVAAS